MSESRPRGLEVQERTEEASATLELSGELDISTADSLQQAVSRLCRAEEPRALVIDLRRLEFIDSSGLAAMVYASRLCERRGCGLSVIPGPRSVQEVFALTGLDKLLPFGDDGAGPAVG